MPWLAPIAAAVAPIIGGAVGNIASQGDKAKALAAQQAALERIMNIHTPEADELRVALQKYSSAGQLAPQMEQLIQQDPSAFNDISTDPRLKNAQLQALQTMQKIGSGDLRPEDRAALADVKNQVQTQENGNREAILQNMQQRGVGGSGAELAAQLGNSQSAANRASSQDMNIAGNASQRALQAIYNSGQLGGQMQAQDFGQQAQVANANDVINRYNAMNSQGVANTNTGLVNSAQAGNLANTQGIMNANTGITNQQSLYNAQVPQQVYQNKLGQAQAAAGQSGAVANSYNQNAGQTQAAYAGAGQAAGKGAAAIYAADAKTPKVAAAPTSYAPGEDPMDDDIKERY